MISSYRPPFTRRYIITIAVVAGVVVLLAMAAMLVSHDRGGAPQTPSRHETLHSPSAMASESTGRNFGSRLPPLESSSDPEEFARMVAHALFDWDTTRRGDPARLAGRLVAVADPTGEATPGLVADLKAYLPTVDVWAMLRPYHTRQWIEITTVEVPSLWAQAVAQAGPGGLLPGTAAFTISGVRHRAGEWEDEPVNSEHEVEFTVFIVCAPSYPECHLLRLSRLNQPLH